MKRGSSSLEQVAVVAQKFQGAQEQQWVSHKGHGQLSPLSCSCNRASSVQTEELDRRKVKGNPRGTCQLFCLLWEAPEAKRREAVE